MAVINLAQREILCKIVYYGAGRCGKTENLLYIYSKIHPGARGKMISIDTRGEKTLFFDFLPLDLGEVKGLRLRVQLYSVPGQPYYAPTRPVVLAGVDGVVFVADSLEVRRKTNLQSFEELQRNLKVLGAGGEGFPLVLQYNKRDLQGGVIPLLPLALMENDLNPGRRYPSVAASAVTGQGVFETLRAIVKLVAVCASRKLLLPSRTGSPPPPPPADPPLEAHGPRAAAAEAAASAL
jgi:hypothetical protein